MWVYIRNEISKKIKKWFSEVLLALMMILWDNVPNKYF